MLRSLDFSFLSAVGAIIGNKHDSWIRQCVLIQLAQVANDRDIPDRHAMIEACWEN